jgi:uncharacterized protein YybS (DUF2232 family)
MQVGQTFYLPLTPAFFLILVIIFVALVVSIEFRVLRYAYMQLGVSSPVASIGGAGTFDGIFLTSIIAVLLGSATRPRAVEPA